MPTARWSEAESPLEWATMPHSKFGVSASYRGAERASVSGNPLHVPGLAPLTGFSRSSDPGLLSGSVLRPNRHFIPERTSQGLAAGATISTIVRLVSLVEKIWAGCASSRPLSDQEQPEVSPHCVQMEQVPAGMVGAPQWMQPLSRRPASSSTRIARSRRSHSGSPGRKTMDSDWSVIR